MNLRLLWGENLLGLSLKVPLIEDERRRKKMGSRARGERECRGGCGRWRRKEGHARIYKFAHPYSLSLILVQVVLESVLLA